MKAQKISPFSMRERKRRNHIEFGTSINKILRNFHKRTLKTKMIQVVTITKHAEDNPNPVSNDKKKSNL